MGDMIRVVLKYNYLVEASCNLRGVCNEIVLRWTSSVSSKKQDNPRTIILANEKCINNYGYVRHHSGVGHANCKCVI